MTDESKTKVRLDKWLWAARFFKTRALALNALKQGKIRYDDQKPNPSREVQVGAKLTITQADIEKTVIVKILSTHRGSGTDAQTYYEETPESIAKRDAQTGQKKSDYLLRKSAPSPEKRPEKDARRRMRQMRRQHD
jgi:ribosome-associated heat shock protein Hsp15